MPPLPVSGVSARWQPFGRGHASRVGSARGREVAATTVVRAALPPGKINHIIVIEFENEGYQTTFGPGSVATYLNGTLRAEGELLPNYYAIGHNSLDNYIAQVSGQSPTEDTQADCADNGFAFANVEPGTPDPDQAVNPGQVDGEGCVYPSSVQTIANQLDAKYPPNQRPMWRRGGATTRTWATRRHATAGWRTRPGGRTAPTRPSGPPTRRSSPPRPTSTPRGTTPSSGSTPSSTTSAECDANVVPLGTLGPTASRCRAGIWRST